MSTTTYMILSMVCWLLIGAATAHFAKQRGRDPTIWFFIGILLGLLGLILVFIMPALNGTQTQQSPSGSGGTDSISRPSSQAESVKEEHSLPRHDFFVKDWFYLDDARKQQGPVPFDTLKREWKEERIGHATFIWSEGMDNWKKIGDFSELKDLLDAEIGF